MLAANIVSYIRETNLEILLSNVKSVNPSPAAIAFIDIF